MKIILFLLLLFYSPALILSVHAQSTTPSTSPIRDSVKQKVDEELAQIKQAVSKKAYLGVISSQSEATLTLTSWMGQTQSVLVGTDAVVKLKSGKDGTLTDLKINDYILVMGDADSQNKLTAKRLLVVAAPPVDKRTSFFGTVTKKTSSSLTLTTTKNESVDIKLTSSTVYAAKAKAADVKVDSKVLVLALGSSSTPPAYSALSIYLFP